MRVGVDRQALEPPDIAVGGSETQPVCAPAPRCMLVSPSTARETVGGRSRVATSEADPVSRSVLSPQRSIFDVACRPLAFRDHCRSVVTEPAEDPRSDLPTRARALPASAPLLALLVVRERPLDSRSKRRTHIYQRGPPGGSIVNEKVTSRYPAPATVNPGVAWQHAKGVPRRATTTSADHELPTT